MGMEISNDKTSLQYTIQGAIDKEVPINSVFFCQASCSRSSCFRLQQMLLSNNEVEWIFLASALTLPLLPLSLESER